MTDRLCFQHDPVTKESCCLDLATHRLCIDCFGEVFECFPADGDKAMFCASHGEENRAHLQTQWQAARNRRLQAVTTCVASKDS